MSYNKLECDYFNLYNQFFKIDRMISLIHGRNMELIKDFMLFYRQIIKKEKSIEILQEQKNKIAIKLSNYMNLFNISPYQIQYSCVFYKDHFNSFDIFYKAVAYYITFKQNLSNKQKKYLALYKIKETTQYYCQIQTEKNRANL